MLMFDARVVKHLRLYYVCTYGVFVLFLATHHSSTRRKPTNARLPVPFTHTQYILSFIVLRARKLRVGVRCALPATSCALVVLSCILFGPFTSRAIRMFFSRCSLSSATKCRDICFHLRVLLYNGPRLCPAKCKECFVVSLGG